MTQNRMLVSKLVFALAIGVAVVAGCKKYEGDSSDSVSAERWRRSRWGHSGSGSGGTDTTTTTPGTTTDPGTGTPAGPTFTLSQISSDYSRPASGAEVWYNSWQVGISNVTAQDRYIRFSWSAFQSSDPNSYSWNIFDQEINKAIDAKQGFSFGIMTQYPSPGGATGIASFDGGKASYPQFLHNQMQAESVKDKLIEGDWVPNINSPSYLTAFENLCKAINNHLQSTTYKGIKYADVMNSIDIRGYGSWGEWHDWPYDNAVPSKPTAASLKRIIDAHKNGFPSIRLSAMIAGMGDASSAATSEVSYYLLTGSNNAGPFGIRRDNWGATEAWWNQNIWEGNSRTYNGLQLKTLIMDKWKTAPITGEPCCNSGYNDLPNQVTKYHVNSFGNGNYGSVTGSNVVSASKLAGARLSITGGSVAANTGSLSVTLNWSNTGVATVYKAWNVVFELKNGSSIVKTYTSSFNPKLFLPGTKSVTDNITGIPAGTYTLSVKVVDPAGYRQPYPLAIAGRQSDGSYNINTVTIK